MTDQLSTPYRMTLKRGITDMTTTKVWTCKIGGDVPFILHGADGPMRDAVAEAYTQLTGAEPAFIFSGWGGELDEGELAVVENRLPDPQKYTAGSAPLAQTQYDNLRPYYTNVPY